MKNMTGKMVQIFAICTGIIVVLVSSNGTWESANWLTYTGMVLSGVGILMSPIAWIMNKFYNRED